MSLIFFQNPLTYQAVSLWWMDWYMKEYYISVIREQLNQTSPLLVCILNQEFLEEYFPSWAHMEELK